MQRRIIIMSEDLSNKIAAGEVIERPSSIVKELLENSIDAGATDIVIDLEKGGKEAIKVIDNGEGINREDISLAFERHATSKIYSIEDMCRVRTYGFRGEALPSISSVSKVDLLTKNRNSSEGTHVRINGGIIQDVSGAGCPFGTSIIISDIFYSIPVRKKFMKKDSTEKAHCIDVITRLALPHTEIKVTVITNKKTTLNIPRTSDLSERLAFIFGEDFKKNFIPVQNVKGNVSIQGFIAGPHYTKPNTKGIFLYVNQRFVRDKLLTQAVINSYKQVIEGRRYPAAVLFIDLPPEDVDVNVHPTKIEVRFINPGEIYRSIVDSLVGTLATIKPVIQSDAIYHPDEGMYAQGKYTGRVEEAVRRYVLSSDTEKHFIDQPFLKRESDEANQNIFRYDLGEEEKILFTSLNYLYQVAGTYLLFSSPNGIILMDQHAAHERVLFEKLRKRNSGEGCSSQMLLVPEIINMTASQWPVLIESIDVLHDMGFEVEPFGSNTVIIKSVPAIVTNSNLKEILIDIADEIEKTGTSQNISEMRDKIYTIIACKSAIKGNHKLSESEILALLKDLDEIPFSSTCPHGRPIYVKFAIRDLEKMFKRR